MKGQRSFWFDSSPHHKVGKDTRDYRVLKGGWFKGGGYKGSPANLQGTLIREH